MKNGNSIIGTAIWALISLLLTPTTHASNSKGAAEPYNPPRIWPEWQIGKDGEELQDGDRLNKMPTEATSANIWN